MPPFFIRSTIFNICFYILTAISCILLLPTLVLPRSAFLTVVRSFVHVTAFLEKYILGLTYEIRGQEHLPEKPPYIVAAKHQSAYETLKLHLLFDDPAIVLKKELLKIPLWGRYLAKSDVIAIDRSTPKAAIKSIQDGARHVAEQNRPIVIFPQGTRVSPDTTPKEKPYKIGVVRMQEATGLPIIPMALNTGVFYPKHAWCKKPGHVVFEFLPPIAPSKDSSKILNKLEMAVEEKTSRLMTEGRQTITKPSKSWKAIAAICLVLCMAYTLNWFFTAHFTQQAVETFLNDIKEHPSIAQHHIATPKITGFPGKLTLNMPPQTVETVRGEKLVIDTIHAQGWPVPNMPINMETGAIAVSMPQWKAPMIFDSLNAQILSQQNHLTIHHGKLKKNNTEGEISGIIDLTTPPYPAIDLDITLTNLGHILTEMMQKNIIKEKAAPFIMVALQSLEKDGVLRSRITSDKNKIYLGPIKIMEFPDPSQAALLENGTPSSYATRRIKVTP